ncbi:hypothetical protein T08_620 [Trichinella sp. T8]|nr:hypothetical protein T08_620 [Trichinella sp. T8]
MYFKHIFVRSIEHREFEKYIAGFLGCGIPHFTNTRLLYKIAKRQLHMMPLIGRNCNKIIIWLSGLDGNALEIETEIDKEMDSVITHAAVSDKYIIKQEVKSCWA